MSIRFEWLIIAGILAFVAVEAWKVYEGKRQAETSRSNEERWEWTDYRGYKYSIEVTRHVA